MRHSRIASLLAACLAVVSAAPAFADEGPSRYPARCESVVHIGDSTSVVGENEQAIPDAAERLEGRYHAAGVKTVYADNLGGRSIVERVGDGTNAIDALTALEPKNPSCYVIAMGTNDAANIAVGSNVDAAERIARVLAKTGDRPVLWPTVKTASTTSQQAYANANMEKFNAALRAAAARHPNLKIYDWAAIAGDDLFADDGIHPNVRGAKLRNEKIAAALTAP